jgi:hypothetical protein
MTLVSDWRYTAFHKKPQVQGFLYPNESVSYKVPMPDSKIGIEIELEMHVDTCCLDNEYWSSKEDGSLRNSGVEYVTNYGVKVRHIREAIEQLFSYIPDVIETSPRTSIHIHMDVNDLTIEQLINLLKVYILAEKSLFNFAGPKRYFNIYCVPYTQSNLFVQQIPYTQSESPDSLIWIVEHWPKYSGFNMATVKQFGTVEFRHLKGTLDIEKILNWIRLLFSMKEFVTENNTKTIDNLIVSDPDMLLKLMFKQYIRLITPEDVKEAQQFLKAVFFTNELLSSMMHFQKHTPIELKENKEILYSFEENV